MENRKSDKGGFFSNLLEIIFGANDADALKKRQLKAISKKLSKSKFNRFYKFSGNEMLPAMGKQIYDIYKAIAPLQVMFNSIQNQNSLKHLAISFSLPEEIRTMEESLSEQNIIAMSKQIPLDRLSAQVEERIAKINDYLTMEKITQIDFLYKQLIAMKSISTFDYYFFLKKFDKTIRENSFSSPTHFEHVNAEYLVDDLKDYIEAIWDTPFESDWTTLFKLLKSLKGTEPISLGLWKRVLARLYALKNAKTFEMIIQLASQNPDYVPNVTQLSSNIVEPYMDKLKNDAENTVNTLIEKQRSATENNIAAQLFGTSEIVPLSNYSDNKNKILAQKRLVEFNNTQALSYIKTFLIEIVKTELREFYDVVVVRGTWNAQTLTSQISDYYNELLEISESITLFDAELAEAGAIGVKIRTLLPKTDRDTSSRNIANRLILQANENAYNYIMTCMRNIITIGKIIKTIVEDLQKNKPTLISNYKELDHYLETPLKNFCIEIYKKIYLFSSLIKTCLVKNE